MSAAEAEEKVPPDRRIAFRVGVHQGDVVVENDDLFGGARKEWIGRVRWRGEKAESQAGSACRR